MTAPVPRGIPLRPDRTARDAETRRSINRAITSVVLTSSPAKRADMALFEKGFNVDLRGLASVRIPTITAALPALSFVGEGAPAPVINLTFSSTTLGPIKKLAIMAAVTEELEIAGPELASRVIGRVLGDATAKALDSAAFSTFAGDAITPQGLLHNATIVTPAAAGAGAMAADLGALAAAIAASNIDVGDLVFVCAPREAVTIKAAASVKFDNVVLPSLGMSDKSIAAFAPAAILSGFGDLPEIETSTAATMNFAVPAGELVNAAGTVSAPVYDIFQQGMIGIRVRGYATWACVPGGAAVITATNW
jgi:hypothetical protein